MAKAAAKTGMKNKPRRDEDEDDGDDEDEEDAPKSKAKQKAKAKPADDDDEDEVEEEEETDEDEDEAPKAKAKGKPKAKARSSDDDDDDDEGDEDGDDEVIDLSSEDEEAGYNDEIVPAATYLCDVAATEFKVFKTGSKGMLVRLEVSEGPYAKSKKNKRGKSFFMNIVMSKDAGGLLKGNLKALGADKKVWNSKAFKPSMLRELADSGDLLGNRVKAKIGIRMYEGEKRNEVKRLIAVSDDLAEGDGDFMDE